MATPLSKCNPTWLRRTEAGITNKNYRRSHRYYTYFHRAWPDWANERKMADIYREARKRRRRGKKVHVDHIVPLIHPAVSGLHCEANLRILEEREDLKKGNRVWLDMWGEQTELDVTEEPHQLSLEV